MGKRIKIGQIWDVERICDGSSAHVQLNGYVSGEKSKDLFKYLIIARDRSKDGCPVFLGLCLGVYKKPGCNVTTIWFDANGVSQPFSDTIFTLVKRSYSQDISGYDESIVLINNYNK